MFQSIIRSLERFFSTLRRIATVSDRALLIVILNPISKSHERISLSPPLARSLAP